MKNLLTLKSLILLILTSIIYVLVGWFMFRDSFNLMQSIIIGMLSGALVGSINHYLNKRFAGSKTGNEG
jgi:hypothetical protein